MSHEYGSLIALHIENRVDVFEPVLLLKLRSILLDEEATALDLNSGKNLNVGFASGKSRCYDLVTGKIIKEFGVAEPMSDVTHLMSVKDNTTLLVAHS